jgi:predicted glycoside hydrolase/deacetylase ChbG (UPF0249 family)
VTGGILDAHAAGTVSSTSIMVHCAGWDDALTRARATPTLGVGLHLNLLVGAPHAAAPTLTDRRTGRFPSLPALVARSLRRALDRDEIIAECEAQLAALARAGITVTHLDSHRHTHALPVIRRAVAAVAARHRLPLRHPVETVAGYRVGLAARWHRGIVALAWRLTSSGSPAPRGTDHFAGITMQGGTRFEARLRATLDALPAGTTELMVHPGRVDDALTAVDAYTWQRERELEVLLSPWARERVARGDIAMVSFAAGG